MFSRILVLAPHTDDGELGCGGTIAKFIEEGKEVYYVALSDCRNEIPKKFPKDTLKKECFRATKILGIPKSNVFVFQYENKNFPHQRKQIFETLEKLKKELSPDVTFTPSPADSHQDHQTTTQEAIRAFRRNNTLLAYEEPWNNIMFTTTLFIPLEEGCVQKKARALKCYGKHPFITKVYFDEDYIMALAKTRGLQIASKYAEAFEVIRWVLK